MIALPFIHNIEPRSAHFDVITLEELQGMLQTSKGAKIVTLVTITEPDLKKEDTQLNIKNPYFGNCVKVSRVNGIINFNYTNVVNNQLKKEDQEPDFQAQPRKWGTRLHNSPFVSHVNKEGKARLYLEVKVQKSLGHTYYNPVTGLIIPNEEVEPWLKKKPEEKLILRDYTVSNIATIVIYGQGYLIKENIE